MVVNPVCILISTIATISVFFFFNDTATTEIYTLSLHDALPISFQILEVVAEFLGAGESLLRREYVGWFPVQTRSEEHTSELQSRLHLVCRLLLEKKKKPLSTVPTSLTRRQYPPSPTVPVHLQAD